MEADSVSGSYSGISERLICGELGEYVVEQSQFGTYRMDSTLAEKIILETPSKMCESSTIV